jgi:hypothetical protein
VRYFSGAAAKVRERPFVSKRATQKYDMERFSLEKLSYMEVGDQCKVKTSNRFAASENLHNSESINRALRNVKENVTGKSLRYYEQQQHKMVR